MENKDNQTTNNQTLPSEVLSLLRKVRFTFSNYESGTIGKNMSEDADKLLKQYDDKEK